MLFCFGDYTVFFYFTFLPLYFDDVIECLACFKFFNCYKDPLSDLLDVTTSNKIRAHHHKKSRGVTVGIRD
jgi:hypothetical protein